MRLPKVIGLNVVLLESAVTTVTQYHNIARSVSLHTEFFFNIGLFSKRTFGTWFVLGANWPMWPISNANGPQQWTAIITSHNNWAIIRC